MVSDAEVCGYPDRLVVDSWLRLDALLVGVFDFFDLANGMGQSNDLGVGVPTGQNQVEPWRFTLYEI